MEDATLQKGILSTTERNMLAYFETHDVQFIAEDAVFHEMSSGREYRGRAEIGAMLHYMYHVAFDAAAETVHFMIDEEHAIIEGFFKGRHIGEFAGIKPTNKEVAVPLCVAYTLHNGLIKDARIYMATEVMMAQLGVPSPATFVKTAFVIRDIFYLKFGTYKQVKILLDEALRKQLLPHAAQMRVLTDFTGKSYRLIFEEGYTSLSDFETGLSSSMGTEEWQQWYALFKQYIESGEREILRQVM